MKLPERVARRSLQLLLGLFLYGIGISLMVRGALGTAPWDVLTLGLIRHLPLSFGLMTILLSVVVLLCWIPLRERPGIGTVLNAMLIGPSADVGLALLPPSESLWIRVPLLAVGIVTIGLATGLYIGARFGPGPRDGLMTGLHRVTGFPIWITRTALEVTVVLIGWLLGGNVGLGTLLFALTIGPICQPFLRIFNVPLRRDAQPDPGSDAQLAAGLDEAGDETD